MRDLDEVFAALDTSAFRRRFRLDRKDLDCLLKWHGIPKGRELTAEEQAHVVAALERWLRAQALNSRHE